MDDWSVEKAPYTKPVVHADCNEGVIGQGRSLDNATQVVLLVGGGAKGQSAAVYPDQDR